MLLRRVHHRNPKRKSKLILENLVRMLTPSRRPKRIRSRWPATMESPKKRRLLMDKARKRQKVRKKRRVTSKSIIRVMLKRLFRECKSKIQLLWLPSRTILSPSWMIIRVTHLFLKGRTSLSRRKKSPYKTRVPPKISSIKY